MSTASDDLKNEFGTRYPLLENVSKKFLGIEDRATIYKEYEKGNLPFPAFRMSLKGRKRNTSPLVVDVNDLAESLENLSSSVKEKS